MTRIVLVLGSVLVAGRQARSFADTTPGRGSEGRARLKRWRRESNGTGEHQPGSSSVARTAFRMKTENVGPGGARRPRSAVEAAMQLARESVGLQEPAEQGEADAPAREHRTLPEEGG